MLIKHCHREVFIEVVRAWVLACLIRSICNLQPATVWGFEFGTYNSEDSAYGPGLANEYKDEETNLSPPRPAENCLTKLERKTENPTKNLNPKILTLFRQKKSNHCDEKQSEESRRNSPKALKKRTPGVDVRGPPSWSERTEKPSGPWPGCAVSFSVVFFCKGEIGVVMGLIACHLRLAKKKDVIRGLCARSTSPQTLS